MSRAGRLQRLFAEAAQHQQAGRLTEAERDYLRIVAVEPRNVAAINNLARTQQALGHPQHAVVNYRRAIAIAPGDARLRINLGNALADQRMDAEAIAAYRHALLLNAGIAEGHNNLGALLYRSHSLREAAEYCQHAITLNPELADAYGNLARVRLTQGPAYAPAALQAAQRYLELRPGHEARRLVAHCLQMYRPNRSSPRFAALVQRALSEAWDRPQALSGVAAHLVNLSVQRRNDHVGLLAILADDELLQCLLKTAAVHNAELEHVLTKARHLMLDLALNHPDEHTLLPFACALAQQCFINEYVFGMLSEEPPEVDALRRTRPMTPFRLALLACYEPLHCLPNADELTHDQWPPVVQVLLRQQIDNPKTEQRLRALIPALTVIDDPVSIAVQRQYESNPYPCWTQPALSDTALPIDAILSAQFPWAPCTPIGQPNNLDVLIAGCGTGQQPIEVARQYAGAQVLAIDLSRTSLAYAQRRAHELRVDNVQFVQADLMQLGKLDRRFDVIEANGVLHHLSDPLFGWQVLCRLLRPGGVMHIGLYSKLGRSHITAARVFLADRGITGKPDGIRQGRQALLASEDELLRRATLSRDFYGLSTCRDLLFHVHEIPLSLPQVEAFLAEHHLTFLGFELEPSLVAAFRSEYPLPGSMRDLKAWHNFEERHPETFFGMYQFWVQDAEPSRDAGSSG
jgi:SAM-dependent methyltransferase/tetratricopeptide (TPR) repeat protein